ncbi:CDP-alcohol phosphatidyltransferase family protein [candidate division KSB1 bacterium]
MDPQPQPQSNMPENSSNRPDPAEDQSWRIMNIPNALSFLRLLLAIPGVILLVRNELWSDIWALGIFAVAFLTDAIDGFLAKHLKQTSKTGLVLDPVADKLAIGAVLVTLMITRGFPIWAGAILIGRDLGILAGSLVMASRFNVIPPARMPGRIGVALAAVTLVLFIMRLDLYWRLALGITLILMLMSIVDYTRVFLRAVRQSAGKDRRD